MIERIEWADSVGCPQGWEMWQPRKQDPQRIQSVGEVIQENDGYLTICPHGYIDQDGDRHGMGIITIPKCCITAREVIHECE